MADVQKKKEKIFSGIQSIILEVGHKHFFDINMFLYAYFRLRKGLNS